MTMIFDKSIGTEAVTLATRNLEGVSRGAKVQVITLYHGANYAIKIGRRVQYDNVQHDMDMLQSALDVLAAHGFNTEYAQRQIDQYNAARGVSE